MASVVSYDSYRECIALREICNILDYFGNVKYFLRYRFDWGLISFGDNLKIKFDR